MNKEAIEHRERLNILEKHIGEYYYMIGNIHNGISDAMEEYHQAKLKLLGIGGVIEPKVTLCDKCYDTDGFYLGTTCPKCNEPFRSVKA